MTNAIPCPEHAILTPEELDVLTALPDGAHEIEPRLLCELETGHPGPHISLGQTYDRSPEREKWLQWDAGTRGWIDFTEDDHCPAEGPWVESMNDNDFCLLPVGHAGRHSFDIGERGK